MALINCPECGKKISDESEKCIHCGKELSENDIKKGIDSIKKNRKINIIISIILVIIISVLSICVAIYILTKHDSRINSKNDNEKNNEVNYSNSKEYIDFNSIIDFNVLSCKKDMIIAEVKNKSNNNYDGIVAEISFMNDGTKVLDDIEQIPMLYADDRYIFCIYPEDVNSKKIEYTEIRVNYSQVNDNSDFMPKSMIKTINVGFGKDFPYVVLENKSSNEIHASGVILVYKGDKIVDCIYDWGIDIGQNEKTKKVINQYSEMYFDSGYKGKYFLNYCYKP